MEQGPASAIGFREVDRDGNPVIDKTPSEAASGSGGGNAFYFNPYIGALWILTTLLICSGA